MLALRRLGVEAGALAAGSVIDKTRSVLADGRPVDELDFAALGKRVGAPTICAHRADLQRLLLETVRSRDPAAVRTGRDCVGCEEAGGAVAAIFADGSREPGDVLIGADGIHSVVRARLFGDEPLRHGGYFAWRGIAQGVSGLLPEGQALFVIGRGAQAGCFHCGGGRVYWFLTRNGPAGSHAGTRGNRAEIIDAVKDWQVRLVPFVEASAEGAILRNDIFDRPPRTVWGRGRLTLLGDAIHATTPNLGQLARRWKTRLFLPTRCTAVRLRLKRGCATTRRAAATEPILSSASHGAWARCSSLPILSRCGCARRSVGRPGRKGKAATCSSVCCAKPICRNWRRFLVDWRDPSRVI
jgi:2-polyprenyl-6-methoxyphenol hydroxylase-like FAD-dependent oxidoreductase